MRLLITLCLAAGLFRTALAHELPGDPGELQQFFHQGFSLHHLPAAMLILIAGIALYRYLVRRPSARNRKRC